MVPVCRESARRLALFSLSTNGLVTPLWSFNSTNGSYPASSLVQDSDGKLYGTTSAGGRGGVKPGITYGETDDFCYNIVRDPVHIHDYNATILRLLGIEHIKLTYRFAGRDFRLTDVHGQVVDGLLA
jgi:uncharacterized protein DUF1501